MRIPTVYRTLAVISCALLSACSETGSSGLQPNPVQPVTAAPLSRPSLAVVPGACSNIAELTALANDAFGAGSPDVQSVTGKLGQLNTLVQSGNFTGAREQAISIIEFTLRKNSQRALGGTPAQIRDFVNKVACFGGLDITIATIEGTYFILPGDAPQILLAPDRLGGISLQGDPVSEPTLISIAPIAFTPTRPGDGPLTTKLDQYKGFYEFDMASANNLPLKRTAVVEICAPTGLDATVFGRLRLGHDASAGFQIEPPASSASFLTCDNAYASAAEAQGAPSLFGRVASILMPKIAFAATTNMFYGGGVSGTVTELSPFAPVDPEVSLSGGVSGTVTELRILSLSVVPGECSSTEAPVGAALDANCRPHVTASTFLGTPLLGAPVTWTVTAGGGQVAAENADRSCLSPFGTSVVTPTTTGGRSTVCWTLGAAAGTNRLRAVGGVGGDVPAGARFADARLFTFTANPPSAFRFTTGPADGASITAGTNIPVSVAVVDKNGVAVTSFTGPVTLTLNQNTFAANATSYVVNASGGVATFPSVSITKAATSYQLISTASFSGAAFSTTSPMFNVVPASAAALNVVQGDNQTALAGTVLPINPTVQALDAFSNIIPNATISWSAGGSSGSSVNPTSSNTDAVNGTAFTVWTVGAGLNELRATLGTASAIFTATGTTPTLSILNQCAVGGSGDAFTVGLTSDPTAFYIPGPSNNRTIREITVFVSASGSSNDTTEYQLGLTIQRGTFNAAVSKPDTVKATTFLRGNTSQAKPVTFVLPNPIVGASGPNVPVMLDLVALTNRDGRRLNFNTGICSPNSTKCNPPNLCKVTQVSMPTPYPTGTFYRQSVAITVKGN